MKKTEFLDHISKKLEKTRKDSEKCYDTIFDMIIKNLKDEKVYKVAGFGTFSVVPRAARKGVNLQTGKQITIPARNVLKFKPSKKLKEDIAETTK